MARWVALGSGGPQGEGAGAYGCDSEMMYLWALVFVARESPANSSVDNRLCSLYLFGRQS